MMERKIFRVWVSTLVLFAGAPGFCPAEPADLLPPPKKADQPIEIDKKIEQRREFLQWHQALGIASFALLTGTVVTGQLNYNDVIDGAGTDDYQTIHKTFAISTAALFAATAIVGYSAPVPFEKKKGLDTVTVHKWSMAVAGLGMITQIVLGVLARDSRGSADEASYAKAHLAIGYGTLGATAVGVGALFF